MKKMFVGMLILTLLLGLVVVHAVDQEELNEAKTLIDQQVSCAKLADEQLELIGEYYMEQIHPGEAHKTMHKMMGLEEGSETEEQFHINMAKTMYCDGSDEPGGIMNSKGMMQGGGMMMPIGMMRNMMGGGMMGNDGGMIGNSFGNYQLYGYTPWWTVAWYIFWIAVVALLIWFLYHSVIKRERSDNVLRILKRRFAKGEIAQKQFEEMKKKLGE